MLVNFADLSKKWELNPKELNVTLDRIQKDKLVLPPQMSFRYQQSKTTPVEAACFLYAKNILLNHRPESRTATFADLLSPSNSYFQGAHDRLLACLSDNVNLHPPHTNTDIQSFPSFIKKNQVWSEPSSYVCVRDEVTDIPSDKLFTQFYQEDSNTCYLIATVLGIRHKFFPFNPSLQVINPHDIIIKSFSSLELEAHIFNNVGGSVETTVQRVFPTGSFRTFGAHQINCDTFRKFGAGIISNFHIYQDFLSPQSFSLNGEPKGKFLGRHAMCAIGFRNDSKYGPVILVQNSWKNSQFLEVSLSYAEKCRSSFVFIEGTIKDLSLRFNQTAGMIHEGFGLPGVFGLVP